MQHNGGNRVIDAHGYVDLGPPMKAERHLRHAEAILFLLMGFDRYGFREHLATLDAVAEGAASDCLENTRLEVFVALPGRTVATRLLGSPCTSNAGMTDYNVRRLRDDARGAVGLTKRHAEKAERQKGS